MNEPKPGGHNDKAENKGNNPEKQNLVQRFNAPPGDQSAAAPKTDTEKQLGPSAWSKILETILECLRHYRDTPREKSKRAEIAIVILTLGIAIAAFWSAWIFQKQLTEARNATNLSEIQWKSQQVPLLGIENNAVSISPKMEFAWSPALSYPTIYVGPINYVIKNFGPALASHEWDMAYALPNPDGQKPTKLIEVLCQMREGIGKGHTETSEGEVVFPGADKHVSWTTNISPRPEQTHVESIWLLVCVSYVLGTGYTTRVSCMSPPPARELAVLQSPPTRASRLDLCSDKRAVPD